MSGCFLRSSEFNKRMYYVCLRLGYDGVERYDPFEFKTEGPLSLDKFEKVFTAIVEMCELEDEDKEDVDTWKKNLLVGIDRLNTGKWTRQRFDDWHDWYLIDLNIVNLDLLPSL